MKKYNEFDYSYLIKDKNTNINNYCKFMFCKTSSMFVYTGLPDTMPAIELERILQTTGNVAIAKLKGDLYAFRGSLHGNEKSVYYKPTQSIITSVALNYNADLTNDKDCIIAFNDSFGLGLSHIFAKYGYMLCENRITQYNILILTRAQQLFSASDNNTVASANLYLKKLVDGDLSVIAENAFFEGLKTHNDNASIAGNLKTLIEYEQYIKASCLNEIGLNANYNMKREALNSAETGLNEPSLLPFPIDMLNNRIDMCERINSLYGTQITVQLNEVWRNDRLNDGSNGTDSNTEGEQPNNEIAESGATDSRENGNGDSGEIGDYGVRTDGDSGDGTDGDGTDGDSGDGTDGDGTDGDGDGTDGDGEVTDGTSEEDNDTEGDLEKEGEKD